MHRAVAAGPRRGPWFNVAAVWPRWVAVAAYALAMAYVESAAVLYLRTIYGGIDPVGPRRTPFDPIPDFLWIEVGREAATVVMLGAVGFLAGTTFGGRFGAFAAAFGLWDIGYYAFLWLFAGWPGSPQAMDVLFLIPLPWWGPVLAPMLIAAVIVVAGAAALAREAGDGVPRPRPVDVGLVLLGGMLCLVAFMADALLALPDGLRAAFSARYGPFPWGLYAAGLGVGALGLWRILHRPLDPV
jgi:hypothetical protein